MYYYIKNKFIPHEIDNTFLDNLLKTSKKIFNDFWNVDLDIPETLKKIPEEYINEMLEIILSKILNIRWNKIIKKIILFSYSYDFQKYEEILKYLAQNEQFEKVKYLIENNGPPSEKLFKEIASVLLDKDYSIEELNEIFKQ